MLIPKALFKKYHTSLGLTTFNLVWLHWLKCFKKCIISLQFQLTSRFKPRLCLLHAICMDLMVQNGPKINEVRIQITSFINCVRIMLNQVTNNRQSNLSIPKKCQNVPIDDKIVVNWYLSKIYHVPLMFFLIYCLHIRYCTENNI